LAINEKVLVLTVPSVTVVFPHHAMIIVMSSDARIRNFFMVHGEKIKKNCEN